MDYDKRIVTLKEIQVSENTHLYLSLSLFHYEVSETLSELG